MKRTSALILSILILLTLTACGKTADGSVSTNEPSASSNTFQAEAMPGLETNPENDFSDRTEPNDKVEDIVITTSLTMPVPETAQPPTAAPQSTQPTTVGTTPMPTTAPTPEPTPIPTSIPELSPSPEPESNPSNIRVTVGDSVFSVKIYDSDTAKALLSLLPMTLNISELNGNEKYYYLPEKLPNDSQQINNINAGDLMLYGSDCLVLFYESFATAYRYTRIGYMEDVSGLTAALGLGSVKVTFAINE